MTETTARHALPLIQPGQAQKELYHNEALSLLDLLSHAAVESAGDETPPSSPDIGQCWLLGAAPTGAWTGRGEAIAIWSAGGWRFAAPVEGMLVWLRDQEVWARRSASGWIIGDLPTLTVSVAGEQVLGPRGAAIADPTGGSTVDGQARTAIAAILVALRTHGLIES